MAPKKKTTQEGANAAGKSGVAKSEPNKEPKRRVTLHAGEPPPTKNATKAKPNDQPDEESEDDNSEADAKPTKKTGRAPAQPARSRAKPSKKTDSKKPEAPRPKPSKQTMSQKSQAGGNVSVDTYWKFHSLIRHLELYLEELKVETKGLKSDEIKKACKHLKQAIDHLESIAPKAQPPQEEQDDEVNKGDDSVTEDETDGNTNGKADALNDAVANISDED